MSFIRFLKSSWQQSVKTVLRRMYTYQWRKPEVTGSTIGFKFHANAEELEEMHSIVEGSEKAITEGNDKLNSVPAFQCNAKAENENDAVPEAIKEHWNLLGKKSISTDSASESAFSNPIETWKKLNVLKEKIAKTVEEKISEMKIDRNILSKTGKHKSMYSKENSSISDSEDTSESSKPSEQWKEKENQVSSLESLKNENWESSSSPLETPELEKAKFEDLINENESELRKRKTSGNASELIQLPDIKVATAKCELDESLLDESFTEEVESGVEAAEHLESTDVDSVDAFDGSIYRSSEDSQTPPGGYFKILTSTTSMIHSYCYEIMLLMSFILYLLCPLSDFTRGFLLSFLLALSWGIIKGYLRPDDPLFSQRSFAMPDYKLMPPLKVPHFKPNKGVWINEYEKEVYDPDYYSVSETVPAYLELDESILKLSRPKGKIRKRASFDEPTYKLHFISTRTYNISGCNVYLIPDGLTKKRLYSKKYPIVIFLRPDSLISETKHGKEVDEKDENTGADEAALTASESPKSKSNLYLFTRCDRQKQEWYRRLLVATRLPASPDNVKSNGPPEASEDTENSDESPSKEPLPPFEHLYFDCDAALLEEYLHYMTKFTEVVCSYRIATCVGSCGPVVMALSLSIRSEQKGLSVPIAKSSHSILGKDAIEEEVKVKPHTFWYRKLKAKRKETPSQDLSVNHLDVKNVSEVKERCSQSFAKSKTSSNPLSTEGSEDKKVGERHQACYQIQWFNAFVNRILFDVFRSPYWLNKIHDKIQRKLNSIRLPYYVEDIEVIEMDLGKTGPMFHRASQPRVDELGLWFDMDATFDGLIRLTIQTHLNLVKLQKGVEESEATQIPEKVKKEIKRQKEPKETFLLKESKEKSNQSVVRKNKKLATDRKSYKGIPQWGSLSPGTPNAERRSCQDFAHKLFDEVTQFAEIAVEESLVQNGKKGSGSETSHSEPPYKLRSAIYDSDLEDSAESSDEDEEEEEEVQTVPPPENNEEKTKPVGRKHLKDRRSSQKIFKVFENVARSKYFRSMAQSKYVQMAIAGVSAARLRLTLEIKSCTGTLTINVPPPPSDRFWYGFREMPKLVFSANPKIGDKALPFSHIRHYLQKKILRELKKVMVTPNMIDLVLSTSMQGGGSSSPQFEDPELQRATP